MVKNITDQVPGTGILITSQVKGQNCFMGILKVCRKPFTIFILHSHPMFSWLLKFN